MERIDRAEGRHLFGADPDSYDRGRPDYPRWVFDSLESSGALFNGAVTLEIGPGSGLATRHLIARGANPIMLVEPDARLANRLRTRLAADSPDTHCTLLETSFEQVPLPDRHFDLIAAATAFHWVSPESGLEKAGRALKPGGTLALIWNVFQDLDKPDPFHDSTRSLLGGLASSPSGAPDTVPFALDRSAREAEARQAGLSCISYEESRWTLELAADEVRHLYGNFSAIRRLPATEKDRLLKALTEIADTRFGGRISRNMTTCLYQFRRPSSSDQGEQASFQAPSAVL